MIRESPQTHQEVKKIEKISEAEERAFEVLLPRHKEQAVRMEDFASVQGFGRAVIKKDRYNVAQKKIRIREMGTEPSKKAKLLEAILAEQIELSDWFGSDALTIIPAEYDDLYNGVDLAVEFEKDTKPTYTALGIDITSSAGSITKKLAIIKAYILRGDLGRIKYFKSERDNLPPRQIQGIPQLVIGTNKDLIKQLSELWLAVNRERIYKEQSYTGLSVEAVQSQKEKMRRAKEELATHRVQVLLLKEIQIQLETFAKFSRKKDIPDVAEKFEFLLHLISSIIAEKKITPDDERKNEEDEVYKELRTGLMDFELL
ncbi:MAG TPA: hypothetical protein VJC06_01145 [Candidatus Paceibacterota bacterium]